MTTTPALAPLSSGGPGLTAHHVTLYVSGDEPVAHLLPRQFHLVDSNTDRQVFAATLPTGNPLVLADRVERHVQALLLAHGIDCLVEVVVESPTCRPESPEPRPWPGHALPRHPRPASDRDATIVRLRRDGHTLQEIADRFGLTRERVRQINKSNGGPTPHSLRRDRDARRRAAEASRARAIRAYVDHHPAPTADQVAAALGITVTDVRRALGADAGRLLVRKAHAAARVPNDRLLEEIRWAATLVAGQLTGKAYDHVESALGLHSRVLIMQRFGTWVRACEQAGVTPGRTPRRAYRRRWTRAQMLDWVATYLAEPASPGSYSGYAAFARRHHDAPSAQTVRNEIGAWATIKAEALRHGKQGAGPASHAA